MAKGVEDTAFYVYTRFLSSNEVGGSAKSFGISLDALHQSNQGRLKHSPDSMLTTSTHDTKRSEDVRNRLNVLSELPQPWSAAVRRWQRMNGKFKRTLEDGRTAPDHNEEYLLYQTILGAWPWQMESRQDREHYVERLKQYASKALSEAKVNLSWINPDPEYVAAVHAFLGFDSYALCKGQGKPLCCLAGSVVATAALVWRGKFVGPGGAQDCFSRGPRLLPGQRAMGADPGRPG